MDKEFIERKALLARYDAEHVGLPGKARELIATAPAADVVSKGLYEQIKWERDVALAQLEEYGVSLGEKADVVKVRHGRWVSVQHKLARVCSVCNRDEPYKFADVDADVYNYCPNCGAKMDKKEE